MSNSSARAGFSWLSIVEFMVGRGKFSEIWQALFRTFIVGSGPICLMSKKSIGPALAFSPQHENKNKSQKTVINFSKCNNFNDHGM